MKEMKTLKFPNQDEPYEIVDAYAREQIASQQEQISSLPSVSYVDEKVAALVNSAPEKLNTLDELAAALGDDENFANTVTTELSKKVNTSDLLSLIYPVGSIYLSVNNVSPSTFLGGTWSQIKDVFLLGAGSTYTAGSTGGEATHTLTIEEMPNHTHTFQTTAWVNRTGDIVDSSNNEYIDYEISRQTQATGGSQPHNNMPPYLVVYMWKRIA